MLKPTAMHNLIKKILSKHIIYLTNIAYTRGSRWTRIGRMKMIKIYGIACNEMELMNKNRTASTVNKPNVMTIDMTLNIRFMSITSHNAYCMALCYTHYGFFRRRLGNISIFWVKFEVAARAHWYRFDFICVY